MAELPLKILELYCERYCEIPLAVLNTEGCITYANRAFCKKFSLNAVPNGEKICGFLDIDLSMNEPIHTDEKTGVSVDLVTAAYTLRGERNTLRGHLFFDGKVYVVIFDIFKQHDVEVIEQVTRLNLEMSSLTRDYSKQYRAMDKQAKESRKLASVDQLTQLWNRRHFEQTLDYALKNSSAFGIILFDIDDFKHVNDTYGHDAGDEVLVSLARCTREQIREEDTAARYGGEEFIILAYCSGIDKLYAIAEKLRTAFASLHIPSIGGSVTASFGITMGKDSDTRQGVIKRADTALYAAKRKGKNRTESEQA